MEFQAGWITDRIKIVSKNINNLLRYSEDTTLKTEGEEKLKRYVIRVKDESEKKLALNSILK